MKVVAAPKVTVKRSEIQPGRWGYYLDGRYSGSAGTRKTAMFFGKQMAEKCRLHWQAAEEERV